MTVEGPAPHFLTPSALILRSARRARLEGGSRDL
jgi:hypothetical protein